MIHNNINNNNKNKNNYYSKYYYYYNYYKNKKQLKKVEFLILKKVLKFIYKTSHFKTKKFWKFLRLFSS
jgi:hypothetical protein